MAGQRPDPHILLSQGQTAVSVVVPVKASQSTVGELCASLLRQSLPPAEILLVGDPGDPTWGALSEFRDAPALRIVEVARPEGHYGRDTNLKRRVGCQRASGSVIAVTDSDMVLPPNWIETGLELLASHGVDSVAGIILSPPGPSGTPVPLLNRYTDRSLLAKTPRFPEAHVVDRRNFGAGKRLPIAANWFFTRSAYHGAGGFDPRFSLSYEDYSFAWQMVAAGYRILCTRRLVGYHRHRQHWRALVKEYVKSGRGCATFILRYPDCPLSRRRLFHLAGVAAAVLTGCAGILLWPRATVSIGILLYAVLAALNAALAGGAGALFPLISLVMGGAFTFGALKGLLGGGGATAKDQHFAEMDVKR